MSCLEKAATACLTEDVPMGDNDVVVVVVEQLHLLAAQRDRASPLDEQKLSDLFVECKVGLSKFAPANEAHRSTIGDVLHFAVVAA